MEIQFPNGEASKRIRNIAGRHQLELPGERSLCLPFHDDLTKTSEYKHARQGGYEWGYVHKGNPEPLPHADQCSDEQSDQHCNIRIPLQIHHHDTAKRSDEANDGSDRKVDVSRQGTQQHTNGKNQNIAVLKHQIRQIYRPEKDTVRQESK